MVLTCCLLCEAKPTGVELVMMSSDEDEEVEGAAPTNRGKRLLSLGFRPKVGNVFLTSMSSTAGQP